MMLMFNLVNYRQFVRCTCNSHVSATTTTVCIYSQSAQLLLLQAQKHTSAAVTLSGQDIEI